MPRLITDPASDNIAGHFAVSDMAAGPAGGALPPDAATVMGDSAGLAATVSGSLPDSIPGSPLFADSLPIVDTVTVCPATDTLSVTAGQMFGEAAYMPQYRLVSGAVDHTASVLTGHFLTDSLVFKLAVLLCFAGYCITLYFYRQQSRALVGVFRSKLYVDNMLGERNYTFDNFLNSIVALGVLTLSLAAVKAADITVGGDIANVLPEWAVLLLAPVVWVLLGVIFLYQTLMLKAAGTLTYGQKFISRLRYLRKIGFAVFAVLLTPFFLMFSTAADRGALLLFAIISALLLVMAVFYVARTGMLFVDEKISKLYWFLYLCGVEIFPVSFMLLSVRKLLL